MTGDEQNIQIENFKNKLTFAWWNTSLAPTRGKNNISDSDIEHAKKVIQHLINEHHASCIAIGEVNFNIIKELAESIVSGHYNFIEQTSKEGRLQFDTGIIYDKRKLNFKESKNIISKYGVNSFRIASKVEFQVYYTDQPFYIFVSHWNSRQHCPENDSMRSTLGRELYASYKNVVNTEKTKANDSCYAILLGDYNDEPFSKSLAEHLLATRDRKVVLKNKGTYLYNPFWRKLGESNIHKPDTPCKSYAGTYYHSSGNHTKWRTFDQIIFSSSFLTNKEWQLNEECSHIIQDYFISEKVIEKTSRFDHFPVISTIHRKGKEHYEQ